MKTVCLHQRRTGATLVELLLFIAVMAIVGVSLVPLLFATTETRLLQQTAAIVEQNGQQMLQTIGYQIQHAERIILPESTASSGAILNLQTGSGSANPVIFGVRSGSVIFIQGARSQLLSSTDVAVDRFNIRNTSTSAGRQSVIVSFRVSRTIRLQAPRSYRKVFEGVFSPFPDNDQHGDDCGCAFPGCAGPSQHVWQVCAAGSCQTAGAQLQCP